jgi:hypothetical protein
VGVRQNFAANSDIRRVVVTATCGSANAPARRIGVLLGVAALLATGSAEAQIPTTGFAIDRHTLAGISTAWVAFDATWSLGLQRNVPGAVSGRSYRELVGYANEGLPTNTIRRRFLGPLVASLRTWARTSGAATRTAAPSAPSAEPPQGNQPRSGAQAVADFASFDQIVMEIKGRLPYIQFCVNASRRRGGPELRRLVAVWSIAPDGSIKELKLEGVADVELATCINRMSRRPLPVKPGVELSIPTPILFVQ